MNGDSSIRELRGIGDKTAGLFHRLGIFTLRDLLFFYPRTYETMESPVPVRKALFRDRAAVRGILTGSPTVRYVKKPAGSRPGMVVYTTCQTLVVDPDEQLVKQLQSK